MRLPVEDRCTIVNGTKDPIHRVRCLYHSGQPGFDKSLLCSGAARERGPEGSSVACDESFYREFERIEVLGLGKAALKIDLNFILRDPFSSYE